MSSASHRITIIGAGLAGALLAIRLAQQGFQIELFERFPHPDDVAVPSLRSINLALAERGRQALQEAGLLERIDEFTIPMRGRMLHDPSGETRLQRYSQHDSEVIYSVHRDRLNRVLLQAAGEYPGIRMHFNRQLTAVDFDQQRITLQDQHGQRHQHDFTTLIGCDGAGSALRGYMSEQQSMQVKAEMLDHGYRELTIPAHHEGHPQLFLNALHVWPRGGFMLIALPNPDHSFTATLFLAQQGQPSFSELSSPAALAAFLAQQFPDVYPLFSRLENDLSENPIGQMGTLYCQPWHRGGQALLLGDAAHAIVPFHGQGMNAAFEDITRLLAIIVQSSSDQTPAEPDWATVYAQFSRQRRPDTDAIAAMALENYLIMRDAVRDPLFHLRKELEWELERRFPQHFVPRYCQVMFRHIPYAEVQRRGELQNAIMDQLLSGISGQSDSLADIDWQTARKLVEQQLTPLAV